MLAGGRRWRGQPRSVWPPPTGCHSRGHRRAQRPDRLRRRSWPGRRASARARERSAAWRLGAGAQRRRPTRPPPTGGGGGGPAVAAAASHARRRSGGAGKGCGERSSGSRRRRRDQETGRGLSKKGPGRGPQRTFGHQGSGAHDAGRPVTSNKRLRSAPRAWVRQRARQRVDGSELTAARHSPGMRSDRPRAVTHRAGLEGVSDGQTPASTYERGRLNAITTRGHSAVTPL